MHLLHFPARVASLFLVLTLSACGSRPASDTLVTDDVATDAEVSAEAGTGDATTDGGADTEPADITPDAPVDSAPDVPDEDVAADATTDVPPDAPADTTPDAPPGEDVAEDASPDGPDTPPPVEICDNGVDDDGDDAIDGADADCEDVRACVVPPYGCEAGDWACNHSTADGPDCANGLDDDGDGAVDCDDPDCADDPPCAPVPCVAGECGDGETCEPLTGRCVAPEAPAPTGGQIGAPCADDAACATADHVRGAPSGMACEASWPGGYCMGGCTLCEDTWDGEQLPRRECPAGSVCLPPSQFAASGSGACVQSCQSDADCRVLDEFTAYFCRRTFYVDGEVREFSTGYCAPPHCQSRGCTGYVCGC